MKSFLAITLTLALAGSAVAADQSVELTKNDDTRTVEVKIGGAAFTTLNYGSDLPKPYFFPVLGPDGTVMSRAIGEKGADHPHHRGIWLAVDEVGEIDFWAEKGKIENVSVELIEPQGNPAKLQVVNNWLNADGQPVIRETTTVSIFANRLVAYDINFAAGANHVPFGDTKEGMFGFRMVNSMRESEGGKVVNAEGLKGTAECWGKTSDWVDYYGEIDGKTFGVAIFDHPLNFRPSRYHVRNYGLFSISPFGEQSYTNGQRPADEFILPAGSNLRLRYALYIHADDSEAGKVAETFLNYLKSAN